MATCTVDLIPPLNVLSVYRCIMSGDRGSLQCVTTVKNGNYRNMQEFPCPVMYAKLFYEARQRFLIFYTFEIFILTNNELFIINRKQTSAGEIVIPYHV